ncbi:MAG TPA: hypothetical protein VF046_16340 [Gemmatimonadales bacterium]
MLVYREQRREAQPARLLGALRDDLAALTPSSADVHDRAVRILIDLGVLEAALADAVHSEADGLHPLTDALRRASVAAGHLLWHSWHGGREWLGPWAARLHAAIGAVGALAAPARIETSVPEGYAYYGLFPEIYVAAAVRCARALRAPRVVCIGIRSIGTSLSAVVTAALEELGIETLALTVRPRGHPFDRRLCLAPDLAARLRDHVNEPVLVVDEGPGLSGSSFAGTARALSELGWKDERIILLPSWRCDGATLRSHDARARWHRHPQYCAAFEDVWVATGRLPALAPDTTLTEVSAGAWRPLVLDDPTRYPAVHPQHERRKLLARPSRADRAPMLLRFAGLGRYGDAALARARALSASGIVAAPLGLTHGFLIQEFTPGSPVAPGTPRAELVGTMARYLAYLRRCHATDAAATPLGSMLATNVREGLGDAAADRLSRRLAELPAPTGEQAVALDGRMLPHEWLETPNGYLKADAVDHHDDHFFPGPQDIAWDVAGTCLEFGLEGPARRDFLERYRRESGDTTIASRLPYCALAYLAFRLGYAEMAAGSLAGTDDGRRFGRQMKRYRGLLERELTPHAAPAWEA